MALKAMDEWYDGCSALGERYASTFLFSPPSLPFYSSFSVFSAFFLSFFFLSGFGFWSKNGEAFLGAVFTVVGWANVVGLCKG